VLTGDLARRFGDLVGLRSTFLEHRDTSKLGHGP
jgi:hypothetical protein